VLQRYPSTTHNLVIVYTTKLSRPIRPIGYKAHLDAKPDTRHDLNSVHLDSNHTIWSYSIVLFSSSLTQINHVLK